MPVITGIEPVARPAGRYAVFVDGEETAVLSLDAVERLRLSVGRAVDGPDRLAEAIALEAARHRAYDRAANMLAFRARSSAELARSLVRKGEEKVHVDWAIDRLREQGLLDDAAFARAFTRSKVIGARQSKRRVQQDLARRGVPRTVGDEAIETVLAEEGVDAGEIVLEAARRKLRSLSGLDPAVRRRRLYAFLARRGYDLDDIRGAMRTADAELSRDGEETSELEP